MEPGVIVGAASLSIGLLINWVWMGLALGAVLKKFEAPSWHAFVPVLRWVAAARIGRASNITVALSRSVALVGALVALFGYAYVVFEWDVIAQNAAAIAILVGVLVWFAGSLTGWVLWIYGAGTVQMRMRAPRGFTWLAALSPVIWASVMGWGKYRAFGGGVAATAGAARDGAQMPAGQPGITEPAVSAPPAPPASSAPAPDQPPGWDAPGREPGRVSPFASLAPKDVQPPSPNRARRVSPEPGGETAASVPESAPSFADPAPVAPEPEPTPPAPEPTPPAPEPLAPPPSDASPYLKKLSPYMSTPDQAPPAQLSPYGSPSQPEHSPAHDVTPATASSAQPPHQPPPESTAEDVPAPPTFEVPTATSGPVPAAESAPSTTADSWVARMQQAQAAQPQPEEPAAAAPPAPPAPAPPSPAPPSPAPPSPIEPPPVPEDHAREPHVPVIPEPPVSSPPAAEPPIASANSGINAGATSPSAASPVISEPPTAPTEPTAPPVAPSGEDEEVDHTIVVRRTPPSWTLQVDNASYALEGSSVVIGRATATSRPGILGIADTTRTVSKRHAELIRRGESWWVRDLGSTNGTYVRAADGDERRVEGPDSEIVDGDLVLGDLVMTITKTEAK